MKKLILTLFLFISINLSNAQVSNKGKIFYLTYPEIALSTFGFPGNTVVDSFVVFITSEKRTTVTLDLTGASGTTKTYTVNAGTLLRVNLSAWNSTLFLDNRVKEVAEFKKAVLIKSTEPITVYTLAIEQYRTDGTFVMPYESIPNNPMFLIGSYFPSKQGTNSSNQSEFSIVAMDRVTVRIKPTAKTSTGKLAGVPFTVLLNKGQVYQVQAEAVGTPNENNGSMPVNATKDLTGTIVQVITTSSTGCGKINVFSGARSAFVPFAGCGSGMLSQDYLLNQVFPTTVLGLEHILTPFSTHTRGYVCRVIATQKNTKVFINGVLATTLLDTGNTYNLDVTTAVSTCVVGDKPVYVLQFMKTDDCAGTNVDGDPAILTMPAIQQLVSTAIVSCPKTSIINKYYINVLIKKSGKNAVFLDGNLVSSASFTDVPCGNYAYTQQSVSAGAHSLRCDSGMIVVTYGMGDNESYAYCSGALFENLNYNFTPSPINRCPNKSIPFVATTQSKYKIIDWDFGDGTGYGIDTGKNVSHKYLNAGVFTAIMRVTVDLGCGAADTIFRSKTIVIKGANPNLPDSIKICGTTLKLTLDATYSPDYQYTWSTGAITQKIAINSTGKYKLAVLDTASKCTVYDSTVIVQYDTLKARIGVDTIKACFNDNKFVLNDFSVYTNDAFKSAKWRYVNEVSDTIEVLKPKISVKFTKIGDYPVFYQVTSNKGCVSKDTLVLKVYPMPIAKLWVDDTIKCAKTPFVFRDSSYGGNGIVSADWDFGDGGKFIGLNTTYSYVVADTFKVKLFTKSIHGCRDTIDTMVIAKSLPIPIIFHKSLNYCLIGNSLFFSNRSKDVSLFTTTIWKGKNNATLGTDTLLGPIKFTDTGVKQIKLLLANSYGCEDSSAIAIKIYDMPKAKIGITDSSSCLTNNFFTFANISTAAKGDNFTNLWTNTDKTTSTSNTVLFSYPTVGIKKVTLRITTNRGCVDTTFRNVEVYGMPDGKFTINKQLQCLKNNAFTFTTNNVFGVGTTYDWSLTNGLTSLINPFKATLTDTGKQRITLKLKDKNGCKDSQVGNIRVIPFVKASFTKDKDSFCVGNTVVNFTHKIGGGVVPYALNWDLGDNTNENITNVLNKKYAAAGVYTISLITLNEGLCADTTKTKVTLFETPMASFTINDSTQCQNTNAFSVTNTSTNTTNADYTWTLTPGIIIGTTNMVTPFVLPAIGKYNLKLNLSNLNGCKSEFNNSLELFEIPIVNVTGENKCVGKTVNFVHGVTLTKDVASGYEWDFGDGNKSSVIPGKHEYNVNGIFNTTLKVTTDKNCEGSGTGQSTIYINPVASFTGTYLESRGLETDYEFNSTTTGEDNIEWTYNKLTDVDLNIDKIKKTFVDTGNLVVTLLATTVNGCRDSVSQAFLLKPKMNFWIPNAFKPDGDNKNDVFPAITNSGYGIDNFVMTIYNRWGAKVFVSKDPKVLWNGKYNNTLKEVPDGVYVYNITFLYFDGTFHSYKGSVNVFK